MIYDLISDLYDKVNGEVDYSAWADFIEAKLREYMMERPTLGLDLGCGTGRMTLELAARGYDMTGVDYSADMLSRASENEKRCGLDGKVLWLCQDITEFELYGTVDFCVSCLDTMNHLTSPRDFKAALDLVHNYLSPDGIFIFDVNCRGKFENVYADNAYVFESGDDMLVWQNNYKKSSSLCDFYVTLFKKTGDTYERYDELQTERMYSLRSIKTMLLGAGFEPLGVYSDFEGSPANDASDRAYIAARCIKRQ